MIRKLRFSLAMLLACLAFGTGYAESLPGQLTHYRLDNGLTVILYQDSEATEVFGSVVVKAGSYHEPERSTGLAHYLEHVLFKGTQEMGTTNWEAEKVYYDQIIQLFEDMRASDDDAQKEKLAKEINELSIKAGEYTISNEFSNLVQSIGGTGLNAGTGYDQTMYYNSFPSYQIERWLELYSSRFVNPVFRGFQAELENVYEEKNMYSDNPYSVFQEELHKTVYGDAHPYGRSIIGYSEHLKNPSLKDVIDFYNEHYVPGNMALVLSGDIDINTVKPLVEKTFGQWVAKDVPVSKDYSVKAFDGIEKQNVKMTPYPQGFWVYNGVCAGHDDEIAIDLLCKVLSNSNQTGMLDKFVLDGDIQYLQVAADTRKYAGSINIAAVPIFDMNSFRFTSIGAIQKFVEKEIERLLKGEVEDWLVESVKADKIKDFKLALESPRAIGQLCSQAFVNEEPIDDAMRYAEKVNAITKAEIIDVAKRYLGDNYLAFYSTEGTPPKGESIKKPDLEPIVPATGQSSVFAKQLASMPVTNVESVYVDFDEDINTTQLAQGVKLYYTPNKVNDIFSLTIMFGAGSREIPAIGLASSLMNSAGVMAQYKAHEVKKEFSRLGCSYAFRNDANYTYVTLEGNEDNLEEACRLLSKLYIIPELDEKQMDRLLGGTVGSRRVEGKDKDSQVSALRNYLIYGEYSPMLTRLSEEEIKAFTLSSLAAEFTKATQYETSVHFVGSTPFDQVIGRLKSSLAFPANLSASNSPDALPFADQPDNTIYFVHNKDAAQSDVFIYIKSKEYDKDQEPYIDAFNEYFSGGFNGIVAQELRELRSYAYTATANYISLPKEGKTSALIGYIGTQSDNTVNAVREFLKLIKDMPEKPERMDNIKSYLIQESGTGKPSFRYLSQQVERWQALGYDKDPGLQHKEAYQSLVFDDVVGFYEEHLKNLPITIAIVGNKSEVDLKALGEFGKVKSVRSNQIFKN